MSVAPRRRQEPARIGSTSSRPTSAAMPPAVRRKIVPNPTPSVPMAARYSARRSRPAAHRDPKCGLGVLGREDGLPDEEGDEAGDQPDDEHHGGEYRGLGGEQQSRRCGVGPERRPDLSRRVLRADDEDTEHADGQLGQEHPVQAEPGRIERSAGRRPRHGPNG